MPIPISVPIFLSLLVIQLPVLANWSSTFSLTSDYLFNGVSQTNKNPALQASIDWTANDFYAGVWGSNIDFGDGVDAEVDLYGGYAFTLDQQTFLDVGIGHYSYWGVSASSEANFSELYAKLSLGKTKLSYWYAWDYFGLDVAHYVAMIEHSVDLSDNYTLLVEVDTSVSLDETKWSWEPNDKSYVHAQLALLFSVNYFDISIAIHHTDLTLYDQSSFILTVSRTLDW